jgi:hypothetical protein
MVNDMTMTQRINTCIIIIEQLATKYGMSEDVVALLRYLTVCKKRLVRRGSLDTFAGHTEHTKADLPEKHGLPPLYPYLVQKQSTFKQDHVCIGKDKEDNLSELESDEFTETANITKEQSIFEGTPPNSEKQELEPDSPDEVPIRIAMSMDVNIDNHKDAANEQDQSWSCSIM